MKRNWLFICILLLTLPITGRAEDETVPVSDSKAVVLPNDSASCTSLTGESEEVISIHRLYWTIPSLCEKSPREADSLLTIMYEQLEAQRKDLGEAHFLAYLSAANAYTLDLHPTQLLAGLRAMQLSKKALQLAPNDPLTLSVRGHIMFYAPSPLGDKRQALDLYTRACNRYDELGVRDEVYPVCKLNIAICYRYLGDKARYKQLYQETISEYPYLEQ